MDKEYQQLVKELEIWRAFHACENPMAWVHHRSPNDVDAMCFNCADIPPVVTQWHAKHIQEPMKLGEDE